LFNDLGIYFNLGNFCVGRDIADNTVRWDNPWETLFHGPLRKENGYEWRAERIHPEDRDAVLSAFHDALAGRDEWLVLEYRLRRTEAAPVSEAGGHRHADRGIAHDFNNVLAAIVINSEMAL
jgi:hypothetical protein